MTTTVTSTEKPPQLAQGLELIGEYEGSGFKEAPFIVRRADGQVVQLPQLLYLVAESVDGRRGYDELAEIVTEKFQRGLDAGMVRKLIDEQLRPLGVVAQPDGTTPELRKVDPLLALKLRTAVVPERVVNAITRAFWPLFLPLVVVAVLGGLVALDVWLFFFHGIAQSLRQTLYDPAFILLVLGLVVLSAAFHECGHATACRYGGARPGTMGVGLYIVWPAFYTDVTDAYRLGKGARLRTDLGGVYFNVVFTLGTAAAFFATGFEPLLLVIPLQHLEVLHQFLPFLRMDGYYIVSDLTGVPDMFARIKPTLLSLLPWKRTPEEVSVLKPWVRGATTLYVLTVVPLLGLFLTLMVINVPRIGTTAWDSFFVQAHDLHGAAPLSATVGVVKMLVLVLPVVGIVLTLGRVGKRSFLFGWQGTEGRPFARGVFISGAAALAAGIGWVWTPNGEYRPIQRGERGTIQGGFAELAAVPTGRPALTATRARQLHGAPFQSSRPKAPQPVSPPASTTTTSTTSTSTTSTSTTDTTTTTTGTQTTSTGTTTTTGTGTTTSTVSTP